MTSDTDQARKATAFRELHESGIFVMPCAWDAGSAAVLQQAGFDALGTTSGGVNWRHAQRDYVYSVPRESMIGEYGDIARAVRLPVSGDLENGYGDAPEAVADTIRLAVAQGMVGGSIEDQSGGTGELLEVTSAAARIEAARRAADATLPDFTLTARAESFYAPIDDPLADAIFRANHYVEAGADCIFVPGLTNLAEVQQLVDSVNAPVSLGIGSGGIHLSLTALAEIGVRRVSTGGALPRALYARILEAGAEMLAGGTFSFATAALGADDLEDFFD